MKNRFWALLTLAVCVAAYGWLPMGAAASESAVGGLFVSAVEKAADGFKFTEGPVWHKDGYLLFSDIPANQIVRHSQADTAVWRADSGKSNGLTFDRQGRLIACEHWNRRVSRTEADGRVTTVADRYQGKRFNSPNDCVVRSDGAIFFTGPPYGLEDREKELAFNGLYCIKSGGDVLLLADDFDRPNGIGLSPDEKTLYVADTRKGHVRSFDVQKDGTAKGGAVLCEMPGPDGLKIDVKGNLYVTSSDGIAVFDKKGKSLGVLAVPENPANCGFGGKDNKTLYITARNGLYKVQTKHAGLPIWTK